MPYLVKHPLLGYLVTLRDESRADGGCTYISKRKPAKRFKTKEAAEEAAGPLLEICQVVKVKQ